MKSRINALLSSGLLIYGISSSMAMDMSNLTVPTDDEATNLVKKYMQTGTIDSIVVSKDVIWKVNNFNPPRVSFSMYGGDQNFPSINVDSIRATLFRNHTAPNDTTTLIYRVSGLSNDMKYQPIEGRLYLSFAYADV